MRVKEIHKSNYYVLSRLRPFNDSIFSWDTDQTPYKGFGSHAWSGLSPLLPYNSHLPPSSLSSSHTGPLPAPFSVMVLLVPQPIPCFGCSNQSSLCLSHTISFLLVYLAHNFISACSEMTVFQLSVPIAPISFIFFVALTTVCS